MSDIQFQHSGCCVCGLSHIQPSLALPAVNILFSLAMYCIPVGSIKWQEKAATRLAVMLYIAHYIHIYCSLALPQEMKISAVPCSVFQPVFSVSTQLSILNKIVGYDRHLN